MQTSWADDDFSTLTDSLPVAATIPPSQSYLQAASNQAASGFAVPPPLIYSASPIENVLTTEKWKKRSEQSRFPARYKAVLADIFEKFDIPDHYSQNIEIIQTIGDLNLLGFKNDEGLTEGESELRGTIVDLTPGAEFIVAGGSTRTHKSSNYTFDDEAQTIYCVTDDEPYLNFTFRYPTVQPVVINPVNIPFELMSAADVTSLTDEQRREIEIQNMNRASTATYRLGINLTIPEETYHHDVAFIRYFSEGSVLSFYRYNGQTKFYIHKRLDADMSHWSATDRIPFIETFRAVCGDIENRLFPEDCEYSGNVYRFLVSTPERVRGSRLILSQGVANGFVTFIGVQQLWTIDDYPQGLEDAILDDRTRAELINLKALLPEGIRIEYEMPSRADSDFVFYPQQSIGYEHAKQLLTVGLNPNNTTGFEGESILCTKVIEEGGHKYAVSVQISNPWYKYRIDKQTEASMYANFTSFLNASDQLADFQIVRLGPNELVAEVFPGVVTVPKNKILRRNVAAYTFSWVVNPRYAKEILERFDDMYGRIAGIIADHIIDVFGCDKNNRPVQDDQDYTVNVHAIINTLENAKANLDAANGSAENIIFVIEKLGLDPNDFTPIANQLGVNQKGIILQAVAEGHVRLLLPIVMMKIFRFAAPTESSLRRAQLKKVVNQEREQRDRSRDTRGRGRGGANRGTERDRRGGKSRGSNKNTSFRK
jgi:hypothetical protein